MPVYLSLVPIIAGVSLASLKELTFSWMSFIAGTGSAVTSVTCALARKNETVIVSGHADGSVAFHRVFETDPSSADRDAVVVDDLHALIATVHVTRTVADARAVCGFKTARSTPSARL